MITQSELQSIFNYNKDTGILIRKNNGKIAGTINDKGYIQVTINYKRYKAHRLIWLYVYGYIPSRCIDHINGIKNDNRIINLRECSQSENSYNAKLSKRNTSGIKGVFFDSNRNKWRASIRVDNKIIQLGRFDSLEQAKNLVKIYREIHHGKFCNHG